MRHTRVGGETVPSSRPRKMKNDAEESRSGERAGRGGGGDKKRQKYVKLATNMLE